MPIDGRTEHGVTSVKWDTLQDWRSASKIRNTIVRTRASSGFPSGLTFRQSALKPASSLPRGRNESALDEVSR